MPNLPRHYGSDVTLRRSTFDQIDLENNHERRGLGKKCWIKEVGVNSCFLKGNTFGQRQQDNWAKSRTGTEFPIQVILLCDDTINVMSM